MGWAASDDSVDVRTYDEPPHSGALLYDTSLLVCSLEVLYVERHFSRQRPRCSR